MSSRAAVRQRELAQRRPGTPTAEGSHAQMLWNFLTDETGARTEPNMWDTAQLRARGMDEGAISRWQQPQEVLGAMPDASPKDVASIAKLISGGTKKAKEFIRAYHGTHDAGGFSRFDTDKVKELTGDFPGGRTGRGHYLADHPSTPYAFTGDLGPLYAVNINAHPRQLLDWNKSILNQSPEVLDALGNIGLLNRDAVRRYPEDMLLAGIEGGRATQEVRKGLIGDFLKDTSKYKFDTHGGKGSAFSAGGLQIPLGESHLPRSLGAERNPWEQILEANWGSDEFNIRKQLSDQGVPGLRVKQFGDDESRLARQLNYLTRTKRLDSEPLFPEQYRVPDDLRKLRHYTIWDDDALQIAGELDPGMLRESLDPGTSPSMKPLGPALAPNAWIQNFLQSK